MFEIEVHDYFSAAHFLKLYDGSYEPKHGHDWKVSVVMRSKELDSMHVVADFELLKPALKKTLAEFDETLVNDYEAFGPGKLNPSTENLAKLIYEKLSMRFQSGNAKIYKVTVWEAPDASASYYP